MRQSQLFPKTSKQAPAGAVALNHKLLVRAGFIDQLMAGSWTLLPLGWRVIEKINNIIREELNATGAQEVLMPLLHPKEIWNETGRWDSAAEVMYKLKDTREKEFALSFTHEEILLDLVRKHLQSVADLPIKLYHFSTKFRNEPRATGGILRGREFLMKDLYSVHATEEDFWKYYEEVTQAYLKIFSRMGLEAIITEAAGGVFTTNRTREFQIIAPVGEDTIYYDSKTKKAVNKEVFDKAKGDYVETNAIEAGNIFPFGTYYSEKMGVSFTDRDGSKKPVYFGSYGIGTTRLMGILAEVFHDDAGLVWPEVVAPYKYHLIGLNGKGEDVYKKLGDDCLFDDRDVSAGAKFADADLIGCPFRLVVSDKTGDKVEIKNRRTGETKLVLLQDLL